jgi:hypothetical protein
MKNPFKKVGSIFKKAGNSVASIFTKNSANKFRDTLSGVLNQQGTFLAKAGGIGTGILANPVTLGLTAAFAPELLPVLAAGAGLSAFAGGVGGAVDLVFSAFSIWVIKWRLQGMF